MFVLPTLSKKIILYFGAVALLTTGVVLLGNPQRNTWWGTPYPFHPKPAIPKPWVFSQNPLGSADSLPSFVYRSDGQRSGYYPVALSIHRELQVMAGDLNQGLHTASKASPSVDGKHIVVGTDMGLLEAYSTSGSRLWSVRTLTAPFGYHSTPALWRGHAFAGDYSGVFYAVDLASGRIRWALPIGHTIGGSPLIDEQGRLFLSVETTKPDGYFAAVDASSGQLLWVTEYLGEQSHSSLAFDEERGILVAGDNAHYINGLDADTGEMLWRKQVGGPVKSTPTIFENLAIVTSWDEHVYAIDTLSGDEKWKLVLPGSRQSSLATVAEKGWGFVNTHKGICKLDLKLGKIAACENKAMGRYSAKASPIATRSKEFPGKYLVWSPCDTSGICVYEAESFTRLREWPLSSPISGELTVSGESLYGLTEGDPGLILMTPSATRGLSLSE